MEANHDMSQDRLTTASGPELITDVESQRAQPFRRFRSSVGRSGSDAGYLESIQSELVGWKRCSKRRRGSIRSAAIWIPITVAVANHRCGFRKTPSNEERVRERLLNICPSCTAVRARRTIVRA